LVLSTSTSVSLHPFSCPPLTLADTLNRGKLTRQFLSSSSTTASPGVSASASISTVMAPWHEEIWQSQIKGQEVVAKLLDASQTSTIESFTSVLMAHVTSLTNAPHMVTKKKALGSAKVESSEVNGQTDGLPGTFQVPLDSDDRSGAAVSPRKKGKSAKGPAVASAKQSLPSLSADLVDAIVQRCFATASALPGSQLNDGSRRGSVPVPIPIPAFWPLDVLELLIKSHSLSARCVEGGLVSFLLDRRQWVSNVAALFQSVPLSDSNDAISRNFCF
jgi:hypothetical protein